MARHGGGAFSGKDPSKVDRSAAYAARYVAKNVVAAGLADRCEVQVAYAIGVAHPVSVMVETFGTEKIGRGRILELIDAHFDLRPGAFRQYLELHRPIYQKTAAYGHFGREDHDFTWESTDKAARAARRRRARRRRSHRLSDSHDGAAGPPAMADLRLDTNFVDYAILAAYFVVVLGIGFAARRYIKTSLDYFLSGRSLPAWITGLAFISANLGALEVIGMSANGAQYGIATVNYYWIGAIPAMVFLGPRDDAVLLRLQGPVGARVPAAALQRPQPHLQLGHVRPRHRPDRGREPVRAGAGARAAARLADHRRHRRGRRDRHGLHQPRRPLVGDLQRGAAVLRDPRGADPDHGDRPRRRRRLERADGRRPRELARRARPARARGHLARQRDEPDRRVLDRARVRPRLRALVRLLDDELRRGPARAVGEGPVGRAAHAADRRVPEAAAAGW